MTGSSFAALSGVLAFLTPATWRILSGRVRHNLIWACALAVPLGACATSGTEDRAALVGACARWRLSLEPRATATVGLDGQLKPVLSLTARPTCASRKPVP